MNSAYDKTSMSSHEPAAHLASSNGSRERRQKIRIVTDSASQVDPAWAIENQVTLLAQKVIVNGQAYHEGVDVTQDELAEHMINAPANEWPQVLAPTVEEFSSAYRSLIHETSEIVSIHVSSRLSDTIQNARVAAEEFRGRSNITILDSQSVALGLNMLVRKVVQRVQSGMPMDDIVRYARGSVKHIYGAFIAEDLQYVAHSGCLRLAQATLGTLLGVIPFLTLEEGQVVAIEKVRTVDRALEKLVEFAAEFEQPEELSVLQLSPRATEKTSNLMSMLRFTFPKLRDIPLRNCGATIGSIVGPTGIGVMIYERY